MGRITTTGDLSEYPIPTASSNPIGIAVGSDGAIWFTESFSISNAKIGRITTAGTITEDLIPPPYGVAGSISAGPDGALWFTQYVSETVGHISTAGNVTEYRTPTVASGPEAITSGADGTLWFTEFSGNKIGRAALDSNGGSSQSYYFWDLAFAGGYQTTLTYIDYGQTSVMCTTSFCGDSGQPLSVPFADKSGTTRTDVLPPGGSLHDQTNANLSATATEGWAEASCTGPVEGSLLYRLYNGAGVALGEASVNAETVPTTDFATFAQAATASTGIAYANPSTTQSASITIRLYDSTGARLGTNVVTLGPLQHGFSNVNGFDGSFMGFAKITSTIPIISLSLNAEAFPAFSSLPPGGLPASTGLVP